MSLRMTILLNTLLVLSVGAFGVLTDEPYWRAVGHSPGAYDYVFWLALALNGPSGFVADQASWFMSNSRYLDWRPPSLAQHDWQFLGQYALWLLLLWPQWKLYDIVVRWCLGHPYRGTVLRVIALSMALIGGLWAYEAWMPGHRIGLTFIDRYFWSVRAVALGVSGVVILIYGYCRSNGVPALNSK